MKARIRADKQEEEANAKPQVSGGALGGLAGYDSDSSGDEVNNEGGDEATEDNNVTDEDAIKAARRVRAKEWAERWRAEKDASSS